MSDRTEGVPPEPASLGAAGHVLSPSAAVSSMVACPYLGLAYDRPTHFMFPVPSHRCHVGRKPQRIALAHQESFCVTGQFRDCIRFPAADQGGPAPVGASGIPPQDLVKDEAVVAVPMDVKGVPAPPNRTRSMPPGRDGQLWFRTLIATLVLGFILVIVAGVIVIRDASPLPM